MKSEEGATVKRGICNVYIQQKRVKEGEALTDPLREEEVADHKTTRHLAISSSPAAAWALPFVGDVKLKC
jgi:hypothetical protein